MWHMNDVGGGWWLLMSVGMVAFWALLLYGVVWLARGTASRGPQAPQPPAPSESPQQVLERRLAAGEVSVEEYERLRAVLDQEPNKPPLEPALH
jgi:putative membrane protein